MSDFYNDRRADNMPDYGPGDDDPRDLLDEDGDDFDCGLMPDGQCRLAGSEQCDFDCPNRDSARFVGSAAWCRKNPDVR